MILTLLACGPGILDHGSGSEVLHTALYRRDETSRRTTLLLSNGEIPCDLELVDDPQERALQLLELTTAACREGARHLIFDLYASPDVTWEGAYPVKETASLQQAISAGGRLASARYYEVLEAELVVQDGLARQYHVSEPFQLDATTGEIALRAAGERTHGTFSLPEAAADGRFRAEACGESTAIFDLIDAAPLTSCP